MTDGTAQKTRKQREMIKNSKARSAIFLDTVSPSIARTRLAPDISFHIFLLPFSELNYKLTTMEAANNLTLENIAAAVLVEHQQLGSTCCGYFGSAVIPRVILDPTPGGKHETIQSVLLENAVPDFSPAALGTLGPSSRRPRTTASPPRQRLLSTRDPNCDTLVRWRFCSLSMEWSRSWRKPMGW